MTDLLTPLAKGDGSSGFHLLFFGAWIPILAWRARQRFRDAERALPDRLTHFRGAVASQALLAGLSLFVAWKNGVELFPARLPSAWSVLAGVALYALSVAAMRPRWRRAVQKEIRLLQCYMPTSGRERAWWLAVSLLAGVGEEISWRGVQTVLLFTVLGSYPVAVVVSALMFGLAHWLQGPGSALIITVFALALALLVVMSRSLYVAMAVHVAYDVTSGLTLSRLGRQLGYRPDAAAQRDVDRPPIGRTS